MFAKTKYGDYVFSSASDRRNAIKWATGLFVSIGLAVVSVGVLLSNNLMAMRPPDSPPTLTEILVFSAAISGSLFAIFVYAMVLRKIGNSLVFAQPLSRIVGSPFLIEGHIREVESKAERRHAYSTENEREEAYKSAVLAVILWNVAACVLVAASVSCARSYVSAGPQVTSINAGNLVLVFVVTAVSMMVLWRAVVRMVKIRQAPILPADPPSAESPVNTVMMSIRRHNELLDVKVAAEQVLAEVEHKKGGPEDASCVSVPHIYMLLKKALCGPDSVVERKDTSPGPFRCRKCGAYPEMSPSCECFKDG